MIKKVLFLVFTCIKCVLLLSQGYEIEKCLFNTPLDEINPFVLNGDLYFSSNNNHKIDKDYNAKKKNVKRAYFRVFAEDHHLDSNIIDAYEYKGKNNIFSFAFHDATKTGYFTVSIKRKNSYSRESITSIFLSHFVDGVWGDLIPFDHNLDSYNLANCSFSSDGRKMYFESDMLNGFGGSDIWCCDWVDDKWGTPINAGASINTASNENTPSLGSDNILYFSSDRRKKVSGYDIFAHHPEGFVKRLPYPINSNKDDMGYVQMDSLFEGYFTSNRDGIAHDVFKYSRPLPKNPYLLKSYKAQECFTFSDPEPFDESRNLSYIWDFGDGKSGRDNNAQHCYDSPGEYQVSLTLEDKLDSAIKQKVGSKVLDVLESSAYYFTKSTKDNVESFKVMSNDLLNEEAFHDIVWVFGEERYYDRTEFSFNKKLYYGQYPLKAYFRIDTVNYLLYEMVTNIPENLFEEKGQKYRLEYQVTKGRINEEAIELLEELSSKSDSLVGKAVLIIQDEISKSSYEFLVKQMTNLGLSLDTKVDKKINSPFIEVCYD